MSEILVTNGGLEYITGRLAVGILEYSTGRLVVGILEYSIGRLAVGILEYSTGRLAVSILEYRSVDMVCNGGLVNTEGRVPLILVLDNPPALLSVNILMVSCE